MGSTELIAGFECSGNRRPLQGLIGNGRWTGVPLKTVLDKAGLKAERARDRVLRRRQGRRRKSSSARTKYSVEQNYGRSLPRDRALGTRTVPRLRAQRRAAHQAPGRSASPDRSGLVWRAEREVAVADPRAGGSVPRQVPGALVPHAQGRDDRRRDEVGRNGDHAPAAQVVRRPRHQGRQPATRCSPSRSTTARRSRPSRSRWTRVRGRRRRRIRRPRAKYGWKFYTLRWNNATPGEHTLVSRATDVDGTRAADGEGARGQEDVPRGQLAAPAESHAHDIKNGLSAVSCQFPVVSSKRAKC